MMVGSRLSELLPIALPMNGERRLEQNLSSLKGIKGSSDIVQLIITTTTRL